MTKKIRTRNVSQIPAPKISEEQIKAALLQIGLQLKYTRERSGLKGPNLRHYEKGVDMHLSTLLNLLHKNNISPVEFFTELTSLPG